MVFLQIKVLYSHPSGTIPDAFVFHRSPDLEAYPYRPVNLHKVCPTVIADVYTKMTFSIRLHPDVVPTMTSSQAVLRASQKPFLETGRNGIREDVPIFVWEVAMNDESERASCGRTEWPLLEMMGSQFHTNLFTSKAAMQMRKIYHLRS